MHYILSFIHKFWKFMHETSISFNKSYILMNKKSIDSRGVEKLFRAEKNRQQKLTAFYFINP